MTDLDPIAIWTADRLGRPGTKTATGLILLGRRWKVACVVDTANTGADAGDVLGVGPLGIPVVADLVAARAAGARSVVVGVNAMNADTRVPEPVRDLARAAIAAGLSVISASHAYLRDEPDLVAAAAADGVQLVDVRTEGERTTWSPTVEIPAKVVLTVGTDSAVGKMTTALLLHRRALDRGLRSGFVATGQIANMCGADAVVHADHTFGDFIIGAVQQAVHRVAASGRDIVFVEGQGAILHRAYGGGIVNILFGAAPDIIVMCHDTDRRERAMFPGLQVATPTDELQVIADLSRRAGIPARLAGFSIFGRTPFYEAATYNVPAVNTRHPAAVDTLLDAVLNA